MLQEPLINYLDRGELSELEVLSTIPATFAENYGRKMSVRGILALIDHFGGGNVYVPKKPTPTSWMDDVLSHQDQLALCDIIGGSNLYDIPTAARLKSRVRNKRIVALREQGKSEREVSMLFGLCGRAIRKIMMRHRNRN